VALTEKGGKTSSCQENDSQKVTKTQMGSSQQEVTATVNNNNNINVIVFE